VIHVHLTCSRLRDCGVRWIVKVVFPAPPTFRVPFTFVATPLSESQEQANLHHTFLCISLLFSHDYDVKMPNHAFYGERQVTTKLYFSFWTWISNGPLEFGFRRVRQHLTKYVGRNNRDKDWEKVNSRSRCRRVVGSFKVPYLANAAWLVEFQRLVC